MKKCFICEQNIIETKNYKGELVNMCPTCGAMTTYREEDSIECVFISDTNIMCIEYSSPYECINYIGVELCDIEDIEAEKEKIRKRWKSIIEK